MCASNLECSDGLFCNGIERCAPTDDSADVRGCIPGPPPCAAGQTCDAVESRCVTTCTTTEDADGDGVDAMECGGADCDDSDANRFPGNEEVCDAEGHDEDCDASTLGDRDADEDGVLDAMCCNGAACGGDCDDSDPSVGPTSIEVCNGTDDDCDGRSDEGVLRAFRPDSDGDGFGDREGDVRLLCAAEEGFVENALDCDDGDRAVNPTRAEVCNGTDDNCDGETDEEPAVAVACAATFGSPPNTRFGCEADACVAQCEGMHFDCNDELSDGCETDVTTDVESCGSCGNSCGVGGVCTDGVCDQIVSIAGGARHTCAIRSTGVAVCWGRNDQGQLGDGTTVERTTPVQVVGLVGALEIDTSFGNFPGAQRFSCARTDSVVWCWGGNEQGQLGNGDTIGFSPRPEVVVDLPGIGFIDRTLLQPSLSVGSAHTCANEFDVEGMPPLRDTRCWGRNFANAIASFGSEFTSPQNALGYPNATFDVSVAAGEGHTCAAFTNGGARRVRCRGSNAGLAQGTGGDMTVGLDVLDAGVNFTCGIERPSGAAVPSPGPVRCWGENGSGNLGSGNTTDRASPERVLGVLGDGPLDDVVDLATGSSFACAVRATGQVVCWGNNSFGQMADGTTTTARRPVVIPGIDDAIAVGAGFSHACAARASGRVTCWGSNRHGELGRGTTGGARELPANVVGL